jgi:thymidylate kinase
VDGQSVEYDDHDRLLYWILKKTYPKPDLAILLDAPAEVLYERKRESTIDELDRRRNAYLKQGHEMKHFVRIDATQPLDKVLADVTQHISAYYAARHQKPGHQRLIGE